MNRLSKLIKFTTFTIGLVLSNAALLNLSYGLTITNFNKYSVGISAIDSEYTFNQYDSSNCYLNANTKQSDYSECHWATKNKNSPDYDKYICTTTTKRDVTSGPSDDELAYSPRP